MNLNNLPFNLFDVALFAVLVIGLFRGRKHGMSEELMLLIKWLAIVFVCSVIYQPIGRMLAGSSPFSLLSSFLMVYVGALLVIIGLFALVKHSLGDKLIGSDVFGKAEYYLGMGSGLVRFSCILVAGLALLNSRYFPPTEVKAMKDYQNDVYGSNYFPTWQSAQEAVFEKSLTGPWIKNHLSFLLIQPTLPEVKEFHQKEADLP